MFNNLLAFGKHYYQGEYMTFYHGSKDPNLKILEGNHSRDGYVYATTDRLAALTYAARCFPNLFSTGNGKICFVELKPHLFEDMTKGKKGYIYTLQDNGFAPVSLPKQKCVQDNCYRTNNDVHILDREEIEDMYTEFLKYKEQGRFVVYRYEDIPAETKDKMTKDITKIAKTLPKSKIEDKNTFWKLFLE